MVYAYDNWVQLPTKDIYDTQMMVMAINAAKDMYEKGQDEIKDFTKTYGDFMSPFAKDMERYGEMVGGVRDTINRMYAAGIDPLRSAEGRAMLSRLTNSIDPAEFNMMRANAKTGYAYLDAIQDLRRKGKYSEAQELFDIMQTGGLGTDSEGNSINTFENFSTAGRGGWNSFTRTSPIEAATLQELTKGGYVGRTARLLSAADFDDPRLRGKYTYDPRYEWSGYLYSDLLKGAPGAVMSASADPRMAYFRNIAEQKVAASGRPYTQADVEAQFQRDVADANTWALIDPTRKADAFAVADQSFRNQMALQNDAQAFQREMAQQAAKDKLDQIRARYGLKTEGGKAIDNNYSLTEELHHDLLYQGLLNSGMPIPVTEINKDGKRVVKYDKDGKMLTKSISQATFDDLEFAANYQNRYGVMQQDYAAKLTSQGKDKYDATKSWNKFKQRYGSRITNIQLAAMLKKQPQSDGGFLLSIDQAKLLRGVKGMMSDIRGSQKTMTYDERISEILPSDVVKALNGDDNSPVEIKFTLNDSGNNATQVFEKYNRGRTDIYATGTVTYTWETGSGTEKKKHAKTIENVQLPLGINSEINAKNTTNVSLAGANRSAYGSIDANYLKQLGQQQKANLGLFANTSGIPSIIDPSTMSVEDWVEFIQNNQ